MKCNGNDVCIIKIRGQEEEEAVGGGRGSSEAEPGLNSGFCFRLTCRDMNSLSTMFSEPLCSMLSCSVSMIIPQSSQLDFVPSLRKLSFGLYVAYFNKN